jgi:hypothetical protein
MLKRCRLVLPLHRSFHAQRRAGSLKIVLSLCCKHQSKKHHRARKRTCSGRYAHTHVRNKQPLNNCFCVCVQSHGICLALGVPYIPWYDACAAWPNIRGAKQVLQCRRARSRLSRLEAVSTTPFFGTQLPGTHHDSSHRHQRQGATGQHHHPLPVGFRRDFLGVPLGDLSASNDSITL